MKLFIGNVPATATEQDVTSFFEERLIRTDKVKLCSDRDTGNRKEFGFLEVADSDVDRALELNGESLLGRSLRIDIARAQKGKR